jgi:hypothetical protein
MRVSIWLSFVSMMLYSRSTMRRCVWRRDLAGGIAGGAAAGGAAAGGAWAGRLARALAANGAEGAVGDSNSTGGSAVKSGAAEPEGTAAPNRRQF